MIDWCAVIQEYDGANEVEVCKKFNLTPQHFQNHMRILGLRVVGGRVILHKLPKPPTRPKGAVPRKSCGGNTHEEIRERWQAISQEYNGTNEEELGQKYGYAGHYIRQELVRQGLTPKRRRGPKPESCKHKGINKHLPDILRWDEERMPLKEMAKKLGVSKQRISQVLIRAGRRRGAHGPRPRPAPEDVEKIVLLHQAGVGIAIIARQWKMSQRRVRRILQGAAEKVATGKKAERFQKFCGA